MSQRYDSVVNTERRLFAPGVRRWPLALARGEGSRVWDVEGREFVDLTAGWGVTSIGHCHPALADAIAEQARTLMQTTNVVYSEPQLELAERLVHHPFEIHDRSGLLVWSFLLRAVRIARFLQSHQTQQDGIGGGKIDSVPGRELIGGFVLFPTGLAQFVGAGQVVFVPAVLTLDRTLD